MNFTILEKQNIDDLFGFKEICNNDLFENEGGVCDTQIQWHPGIDPDDCGNGGVIVDNHTCGTGSLGVSGGSTCGGSTGTKS